MTAGKELKEHTAPGDATVHCLEGKIVLTVLGIPRELTAGELLYFPAGEPHSVRCLEDASFLLTLVRPT